MPTDANRRAQAVRNLLAQYQAHALLITHLPHIRWLCGFTGSRALVLITPEAGYFLTDHRYGFEANQLACGLRPHIKGGSFSEVIRKTGWLDSARRVVFQPEYMSVANFELWKDSFAHIDWQPVEKLLDHQVARKSAAERVAIAGAQRITDLAFEAILDTVNLGMSELEVAIAIELAHRELGAERMAFDTIVASGPNSARPHARPGSRCLESGDCVILDCGCVYGGMASDMTRTIFMGGPTREMRRVYAIVREAQECAIKQIGPDVDARAVDKAARQVIEEAGYGPMFKHSTGHGLGYDVHEWPRIGPDSEDTLPLDCVVTIEPGIYLDGKFGIRIEDSVRVYDGGGVLLPNSTRDLICL
ncbi:MAG: aminopeptidase P family protein [Bacteroidota bacterium]|nr:aminopeptidase P family protein [Bacteroidota bacterium]